MTVPLRYSCSVPTYPYRYAFTVQLIVHTLTRSPNSQPQSRPYLPPYDLRPLARCPSFSPSKRHEKVSCRLPPPPRTRALPCFPSPQRTSASFDTHKVAPLMQVAGSRRKRALPGLSHTISLLLHGRRYRRQFARARDCDEMRSRRVDS